MRAFTAATVERRRCALYLALFIYLVLAGVEAYTVSPYVDEAFQASPAHNLITEGHMGTSILEETSTWRKGMSLKGINRYTYWVMPLHFVAQAGWYEVAGFGLLQLRALSMVWGLLALMSCYLLVKTLTGDERPAILIVALLSVDGVFLDAASFGRADMMAAALGFAGLAVYMRLRGKRFALAIVLANALIAGAVFTHLAAMPALLGLVFLGVFFDFRRSRPHHLCLGALPYLAIGAGWGLYILQYPAGFREQFGSNFAGRIGDPVSLWALVAGELTLRYLPSFGFAADSSLAWLPIRSLRWRACSRRGFEARRAIRHC
jgi:hypothetical protein